MPYAFGAAAGGEFPQLILTNSQTWVPPIDGTVVIHVIGAGGGGSGRGQNGGGGGGYVKLNSLAVTTGGSFTVTIGAGGPPGSSTTAGTAGGTSSVSGTGISGGTLTAAGGAGGRWNGTGAGGAASNGNVNNVGGAGGRGGGAVGIYGTGASGGGTHERAGQTDAQVGDCGIGASQYGDICGGVAPNNVYNAATDVGQGAAFNGGDLCGGAGMRVTFSSVYSLPRGGNGGVGGGGGGTHNDSHPTGNWGAYGGDGIVLIQYLPW